MPTLSVAEFVKGLAERGLALRVEGERLVLIVPAEARAERIHAYVRSSKQGFIEYLHQQESNASISSNALNTVDAEVDTDLFALDADLRAADEIGIVPCEAWLGEADDVPPVEAAADFEDMDAPEVAEAVRRVYDAAQARLLPVERVSLGPGHSFTDPNAYVVRSPSSAGRHTSTTCIWSGRALWRSLGGGR